MALTCAIEPLPRPTPIHVIGDSHVLPFHALLVRERSVFDGSFIALAKYVSGLRARTFTDPAGVIHPGFVKAMAAEYLLCPEQPDMAGLRPFHRSETRRERQVSIALGMPRLSPVILVFCGDIDLRTTFLRDFLGHRDFRLPYATPFDGLWEASGLDLLPYETVLECAEGILHPLLDGLGQLVTAGFDNLFLHSLPPPIIDDDRFERINSYRCPASIRYKATVLFNRILGEQCRERGIAFLNLWEAVISDNILDARYELDGVHLNQEASLISLEMLLSGVAARNHVQQGSVLYDFVVGRARSHYHGQAGQGMAADTDQGHPAEGIWVQRVDPAGLQEGIAQLDYGAPAEPSSLALDWVGNEALRHSGSVMLARLSPTFMARVYQWLFSPALHNQIADRLACDFTVLNVRPVRLQPDSQGSNGLQDLHPSHAPAGIFYCMLYLSEVTAEAGPFAYRDQAGEIKTIVGPAGTMIVYDGSATTDVSAAPRTRTAYVLDLTLAPLFPGRSPRLIAAGSRSWPVDPFQFFLAGCLVHP